MQVAFLNPITEGSHALASAFLMQKLDSHRYGTLTTLSGWCTIPTPAMRPGQPLCRRLGAG